MIENICCLNKLTNEELILSKNKTEVCLDILNNNKNGKFIIYSSFDNIYYQLFEEIDRMGLKAERIESNLFSLLKTVKNFQEGKTNILFVSNVDLIRGLSLSIYFASDFFPRTARLRVEAGFNPFCTADWPPATPKANSPEF